VQGVIDVNSKDEGLQSPLLYATKNGHSEIVQLFLALADIDVKSWDERLQSLLWYAAKNRHLEIMQQFLAQVAVGVDVMVDPHQQVQIFPIASHSKHTKPIAFYSAIVGHSVHRQQCSAP
jgi:ankyrin repeat protein